VLAILLALLMLILGGFGGLINASYAMNVMVHNTAWVPGHFHLIFGGTTIIMYFGIAYYFWPVLSGKPLFSNNLALIQLWSWFIGMVILTTPWHILGLLGQPRRIDSVHYNNLLTLSWEPYEITMIFGGLVMAASAGLLIYILVKTQFYATETYAGEIEYAEPIRPVQSLPPYLNSFTVWNWVIAGFMLVAFGYPIAQFFLMKTYGSSPWGY
jgi:cytochrome c oxidase subunit 1